MLSKPLSTATVNLMHLWQPFAINNTKNPQTIFIFLSIKPTLVLILMPIWQVWFVVTLNSKSKKKKKIKKCALSGPTLRVGFKRTIFNAAGTTTRFLCKKEKKTKKFKINKTLTRSNTMTQRVSVRCNVLRGNSNNVGKEISITDMFALTASSGWRAALPCHKEEEYRQTPSASPEQPAHAWFCGEAYL